MYFIKQVSQINEKYHYFNRYFFKKRFFSNQSINRNHDIEEVSNMLLQEGRLNKRKALKRMKSEGNQFCALVLNNILKISNKEDILAKIVTYEWKSEDIGDIINHGIRINDHTVENKWKNLIIQMINEKIDIHEKIPIIQSLPTKYVPDYSIPITKHDDIYRDYLKWVDQTNSSSDIIKNFYNASDIGNIIVDTCDNDIDTSLNIIKGVVKNYTFNKDLLNSLHFGNVIFGTLIERNSKLNKNEIGELIVSYNNHILNHLRENSDTLVISRRSYIGMISLLIAETASRRNRMYHDVFLIKHLLDRLVDNWPQNEIDECSKLISKKFTVMRYIKLLFQNKQQ